MDGRLDQGSRLVAEQAEQGRNSARGHDDDGFAGLFRTGHGATGNGEHLPFGLGKCPAGPLQHIRKKCGSETHVDRSSKNEGVGMQQILADPVHVIPDDATGDGFPGAAVPAGETVPAELDVAINQVQLLDLASRNLRPNAIDGSVDQEVGRFPLTSASYDGHKIHGYLQLVDWVRSSPRSCLDLKDNQWKSESQTPN